MSDNKKIPPSISWDEYKKTIFTPEEIAACNLKVAENFKKIEAKRKKNRWRCLICNLRSKTRQSTELEAKCMEQTDDRSKIFGEDVVQFENASKEYIANQIATSNANGQPVALYDAELKRAYLEYPDGRRDYDFNKAVVIPPDSNIADQKRWK